MTADILASSLKLCRWAESEIGNFESLRDTFLRENPTKIVQTICTKTCANIIYPADIVMPPEVYDGLERLAYRIVGDLRNALDQACHAASVAIGSSNDNKTNFPMATNELDLDKRLSGPKGSFGGIPIELHGKLKDFRPFWNYRDGREGNVKLRTIGKIANPNKHKVPLSVLFSLDAFGIETLFDISLEVNPIHRISKPDRPEIRWLPTGFRPELKINFYTIIRISDDGVFSKHEAASAFREMLSETKAVIAALSEECRRILDGRAYQTVGTSSIISPFSGYGKSDGICPEMNFGRKATF